MEPSVRASVDGTPCIAIGRSPGVPFFLSVPPVTLAVAVDAKRNQVGHHITAELAPAFHVMDLQVLHGTAHLTPPAVSFEYALSDYRVLLRIQFQPRLFLP
jgi:hypothetical protein